MVVRYILYYDVSHYAPIIPSLEKMTKNQNTATTVRKLKQMERSGIWDMRNTHRNTHVDLPTQKANFWELSQLQVNKY